jgi:Secretion system C-terminal sorting domain
MFKMLTTKGFLVTMLLALSFNNAFSQTAFWSETFATPAAFANWTTANTGGGLEVWTRSTDPAVNMGFNTAPAVFGATSAADGYAFYNSDVNGQFIHDATLTSQPISCASKTSVKLRFKSQFADFTGSDAEVRISIDGGATWTPHAIFDDQPSYTTAQFALVPAVLSSSISIPEANNQAQVWIQFRWVGEYEYGWKLDDVELFDATVVAVPCALNPNSIICDNLDTYVTNLKLGPQATWWTTWSGTEGNTEDGIVSTEQAASAPNSLKMVSTAAAGGPQDVVLNLGNKTTGNYSLKWKMYVPEAKSGYYNIQNVVPIGAGSWNLDVLFTGGVATASVTQVDKFSFPYTPGTWVSIEHKIDLDNNILKYFVNGTFVGSIPFPNNLGGIDFYCTNNIALFYIDDVEYVSLPPVVYNVDICESAIDLTPLFGGAPSVAQTSSLFDNTTATLALTDPLGPCFGDTSLNKTQWFTFPGDGKRYHIETVKCTATNYIGTAQNDPGDTQMNVFTGSDCNALNSTVCNDDLFTNGVPDWRAGLDIETVAGENYYILIDGFRFNNVVATGEYCIEVTQQSAVTCAEGVVGTFELANNGFVCFGDSLANVMVFDETTWTVPEVGPVYGNAWCITAAPIDPAVWPGTIVGVSSTRVNPTITSVFYPNNAMAVPGKYYLTPVTVGGGTLINPANAPNVFNVNVTTGCFFVGESLPFFIVPDPSDPNYLPVSGSIDAIPGPTGTLLDLTPTGGLGEFAGDPTLYTYLWSTGATTEDITVTGGGNYTVTVSDASGCIDPVVIQLTGIKDPSSVKNLSISPNPTNNNFVVNLGLENALDVRAELVNSLGQVLRSFDFGKVSNLNETINVADYADGVYFLRLSINGQKTQRSVVVSH